METPDNETAEAGTMRYYMPSDRGTLEEAKRAIEELSSENVYYRQKAEAYDVLTTAILGMRGRGEGMVGGSHHHALNLIRQRLRILDKQDEAEKMAAHEAARASRQQPNVNPVESAQEYDERYRELDRKARERFKPIEDGIRERTSGKAFTDDGEPVPTAMDVFRSLKARGADTKAWPGATEADTVSYERATVGSAIGGIAGTPRNLVPTDPDSPPVSSVAGGHEANEARNATMLSILDAIGGAEAVGVEGGIRTEAEVERQLADQAHERDLASTIEKVREAREAMAENLAASQPRMMPVIMDEALGHDAPAVNIRYTEPRGPIPQI